MTTTEVAPSSTSRSRPLGCALIQRTYLVNVAGLEHERWERAHRDFCRKFGIERGVNFSAAAAMGLPSSLASG
jgi:hypothetical protein